MIPSTETERENRHLLQTHSQGHFTESEFPDRALYHMSPGFLHTLLRFRNQVGIPLRPSTNPAGWYRTHEKYQYSRHYAVRRRSDAGDLFPVHSPGRAFLAAMNYFTGVGIYFDTRWGNTPKIMLHLDTRQQPPVIWIRRQNRYIHLHQEPTAFWAILAEHSYRL